MNLFTKTVDFFLIELIFCNVIFCLDNEIKHMKNKKQGLFASGVFTYNFHILTIDFLLTMMLRVGFVIWTVGCVHL